MAPTTNGARPAATSHHSCVMVSPHTHILSIIEFETPILILDACRMTGDRSHYRTIWARSSMRFCPVNPTLNSEEIGQLCAKISR
jgi:hypothetical protein